MWVYETKFIVPQGCSFGRCSGQGQWEPLAEEKLGIQCWAWWKVLEVDVKSVHRDSWWGSKWNGKGIQTNLKKKSLWNKVQCWTKMFSLWRLSRSRCPSWEMQEVVVMTHPEARCEQHKFSFYLVVWEICFTETRFGGGRDFRKYPSNLLTMQEPFRNQHSSKPLKTTTSVTHYLSGLPNPFNPSWERRWESKTAGLAMPTRTLRHCMASGAKLIFMNLSFFKINWNSLYFGGDVMRIK